MAARAFWCCMLILLVPHWVRGNGLRIWPGPASSNANQATFWVAWQNGWNTSLSGGNYDAVWLFAKEASPEGGNHLQVGKAYITFNASRFQCRVSTDERGIWLYPSPGYSFSQDSALLEVQFVQEWQGMEIRGIEMVCIPEGPFMLGDSISNNSFAAYGSASKQPFHILSSGPTYLNKANGIGIASPADTSSVSRSFPIGFDGFFCQKYEISQGQWVDFLNALSLEVREELYAGTRLDDLPPELNYRRGVFQRDKAGLYSTTTPYRAAGGLNKADILAYCDWACLRPMTETEFEKACRGPLSSLQKEFAWGSKEIQIPDSLQADGTENEAPGLNSQAGRGWANCAKPVGQLYLAGPARQGFPATATSNRVEAGAGYYGCLELSGNVWETCIRLDPANANFTTMPGDGTLSMGRANERTWENIKVIVRGGGHASLVFNDIEYMFRDLAVSDRFYLNYDGNQRRSTTGGRGVRSW